MAKKKENKTDEKKLERKQKKIYSKQATIIVIFIVVLLVSVWAIPKIARELRKFEYAGLNFEKGKQGNEIMYLAKIPMKDIFGNTDTYLNVYFREDPRNLRNIEISEPIRLFQSTGIAADSSFISSCEDSIVAATTLSIYLGKFGVSIVPSTTNKTEAEKLGRTYVTCNNGNKYSVIEYQPSNETKIEKVGSCYILKTANCDIMNVTERFMVGFYAELSNMPL